VEVAVAELRTTLLGMLQQRVLGNVQQAEQFATGGDGRRAKVRLKRAERGLVVFVWRLDSPLERRAVPDSVRQPLKDEARGVRKTLAALAATL
jgi:hypothetical protein